MRGFKLTRDFYIPKGSTKIVQKDGDGIVYIHQNTSHLSGKTQFFAMGFHGNRSQKPDFNYSFRSEKAREDYVRKFFEGRKKTIEFKAGLKVSAKNPHTLKVGDILVTSWGYSMTFVDFYEIVELTGKCSAMVRKLSQVEVSEDSNGWSGRVLAEKGHYVGEPFKVFRITADNTCKIDGHYAHKWTGQSMYWNRLD